MFPLPEGNSRRAGDETVAAFSHTLVTNSQDTNAGNVVLDQPAKIPCTRGPVEQDEKLVKSTFEFPPGKHPYRSGEPGIALLGKRFSSTEEIVHGTKYIKRFHSSGETDDSVDIISDGQNAGIDLLASASATLKRENDRKLNAIYSRTKRQRKKAFVEELLKKNVSLQEENDQAKKTNQTLEDLLSQAKSLVTVYEAGKASGRRQLVQQEQQQQQRHFVSDQLLHQSHQSSSQTPVSLTGPCLVPLTKGRNNTLAVTGQDSIFRGTTLTPFYPVLSQHMPFEMAQKENAANVDQTTRDRCLNLILRQQLTSFSSTNTLSAVTSLSSGRFA